LGENRSGKEGGRERERENGGREGGRVGEREREWRERGREEERVEGGRELTGQHSDGHDGRIFII
jgi:hypothetical protein